MYHSSVLSLVYIEVYRLSYAKTLLTESMLIFYKNDNEQN